MREALGDRLEAVRLLVGMHHRRQQQRVEYRLLEPHARLRLLELQEAHVERGVVRDQHGLAGVGVERPQHLVDRRLAGHHVGRDAVDRNRRRRNRAVRIDQLLEAFAAQELAVDEPRRADLDDLVAPGGIESRGLGVEHGVRKLGEPLVVQRPAALRAREQVEIVVLRPAAGVHERRVGVVAGRRRRRERQQEAEERAVAHAVALEPELAAVALHDVAHRRRAGLGERRHRIHLPGHDGFRAHHAAAPHQVEMRALPRAGGQPQLERIDCELVVQALRKIEERLEQRKAVDLEPERRVHVVRPAAHARGGLDPAPRRLHEVGADHLLERPAGHQRRGALPGDLVDPPRHRGHLFLRHAMKALAHGGVQGVVLQHLHRRPQVRERASRRLGQLVQQALARGLLLVVEGDVLQHQHEARDRRRTGILLRLRRHGAPDRRHLHAQQLA